MKNIIKRSLLIAEKTIVVICIVMVFGLVGDGDFSLSEIRQIFLYGALLGVFIGASVSIFDVEKLNDKAAYIMHFTAGYLALNVLEGLIFSGTLLPQSPPINYLYKFLIYSAAYLIITFIVIYKEKVTAKKMTAKIKEIKKEKA